MGTVIIAQSSRIVCFDIASGKKVKEIVHDDMATVYAIKYDPTEQVLHAATGDNHGGDGLGFTFDASKDNFGTFVQKWSAEDRVIEKR